MSGPLIDDEKRQGVWHIMSPVQGQINLAIVLSALSSLTGLISIVMLALVAHALMVNSPPWGYLFGSAGMVLLAIVTKTLAFNISHFAAFRLETLLRRRMSEHLARVSLGFLVSEGSGALTKVMQDDVKNLHAFVADSTPFIGRSIAAPLATLVLLTLLDWRLMLVGLAVLLVGMALLSLAMRNHEALQRQYDQENEQISARVVEFVQAMPVVRTFDSGSSSFGRYVDALKRYDRVLRAWMTQTQLSSRLTMLTLAPLPTLLALSIAGVYWIHEGALEITYWLAVLLIGTGLAEALMPLMWLAHAVRKSRGSALRIQQLLCQPALSEATTALEPRDASVEFREVSFAYDNRNEMAVSNINLRIEPGKIVAVVGPSGSGKSTLVRLIPRFWEVTSGAIFVGGVDIRQMDSTTLMNQIAFVFQDTFLFQDTLKNNICLGSPSATEEEMICAAQAANIHDDIIALPQGYNTMAGERGTKLSGGQRQRITLARAILQNRPILLLDEATAFADPESEASIVRALSYLVKGKTVFVIAHRLSTIRHADQILVMDHGQLVEQGQHDTLCEKGGLYARLWKLHESSQGWVMRNHQRDTRARVASEVGND